jgi:hypothetical protein
MNSATTSESRIEELRFSVHISHDITIALNTRIYLTLEIFLVNVTLRLLAVGESNCLKDEAIADSSIRILDGIEVNNHVGILGSKLHLVRFL